MFESLKNAFKKAKLALFGEDIFLPSGPHVSKTEKLVTVNIVRLLSTADLPKVRTALDEGHVVFINITAIKNQKELQSIANQLHAMTNSTDSHFYGMDPRWLVMSKFELESAKKAKAKKQEPEPVKPKPKPAKLKKKKA
ncbi:MAG: hypothetical protein GOU99_00390 [Candidatus Altiarchaeota archaeon]|nr:hypothetical protein [Candidatus Altiarchaeota archaeon]